ncbi:hypothetical protein D3870_09640 [Noviherbaspirillum cavernae]|uniref:Uncharacterized protein n=1 Tax=Noviherbaspirillum cavernae TaxID=2320862 RepID=A0A418X1C0_9BURK|nr:hypothetical protein [Noviherbaspirillum cavernae]RJG06238.1 hypothetical protein D3870_09640 [Noviherbaspirillum cavernae]
MTEPTSSVAGFAIIKLYGLKAVFGMVGAALLYFVLPPLRSDGRFSQQEFVVRLAAAGIGSCFFGDVAVQQIMLYLPSLHADQHTSAVYLLVGAPFWWITRAVALSLRKREDKDIVEIVREAKESI